MAGDWVKIEKATARKPEILRIAAALQIPPDQAFGLCFRFWSWCDDNLETGNVSGVTTSLVDELLGRVGFSDALISVGWLRARAGSLEVPNFDRHLSESAKNRALTAQRVAKCKKKKGNEKVTPKALPEKRREELEEIDTHTADPPAGFMDFEGCNDAILTILDPETGDQLSYRDQDSRFRWQQLLVIKWNATFGVCPYPYPTLDSACERDFHIRLKEHDWDWRTALMAFPVNFERPSLAWFLELGIVQKINAGKYLKRDFSKKGKKNDRKGPDNAGSVYNPETAPANPVGW